MHISHIAAVVVKRTTKLYGAAKADPGSSQVLADIRAGEARRMQMESPPDRCVVACSVAHDSCFGPGCPACPDRAASARRVPGLPRP
jgi:hypothetical protein